jgi:peptide/nickel transport system ATP-binding protein
MRLPHCAIGISFSMSFAMSCRRRASSLKSQATQASISYASIDRSVLALDGAELTIEAGESLAIVGESGSGRSTLGMAIGRLLPPEARRLNGDLIYEGRSVFTASDEEVRSLRRDKLGFIFQSPMAALDPTMRVGRQVALAIGGHPEMADIAALLERAELSDPDRIMRSFPHQLSGGMAQHVVIAMAIARGQRLLIAAEPTASLDASIRDRVMATLSRLRRESSASHDLRMVGRHAARIAVMYAGRVVETGTSDRVSQCPAHPYTRALMTAAAGSASRGVRLEPIPGAPPVVIGRAENCAFAPRCLARQSLCFERRPETRSVHDRIVACHFAERILAQHHVGINEPSA